VSWPDAEVFVDTAMVRALLSDQFPELAGLPLRVAGEGFDNFLFRLGEDHVVRLPRRARGVEPLENELRWLAVAASKVTLATPLPVLAGSPCARFAWPWMITSWIEGVAGDEVDDDWLRECALPLATFLRELHVTAPHGAPMNPWRSVPLAQRACDLELRLEQLGREIDTAHAWSIFEWAHTSALRHSAPTWLHGDVHPGNLIFREKQLIGVVDFGDLCAGDPATDLAGGLLTLPYGELATFFDAYGTDDDATLARTIGWAVLFGTMMVGLGRTSRPRYMRVGQRALDNAARLAAALR
jgi:aminoglycoside phosphotransferase (APT) family kinase protein